MARKRKSRRSPGEGSVWFRSDTGKYEGALVVGYTPAGNPRRVKKSFPSSSEATAWVADQKLAIAGGTRLDSTATLREAFEEWLAAGESVNGWAAATTRSYRGTLEKHVMPKFGRARLRDINASDVRRLLTDMSTNGASASMVRRVRLYLGILMRDAVRMGLIVANPVDAVKTPAAPDPVVERWSEDEVAAVVRECLSRNDQAARYVLVALGTGLRTEELLGLTWAAVDLDELVLEVRQVATESGPKVLRAGAKTDAGARQLPFDPLTGATLAKQREYVDELLVARDALNAKRLKRGLTMLPWADLDLVFVTSLGTILDRHTLRAGVDEIQAAAKVARIRLYATRSTHGSLLADAGVNLHALAERLGHVDRSFTARRYLRGSLTAHRAVADKIGSLLSRGRSGADSTDSPVAGTTGADARTGGDGPGVPRSRPS